MKTDSEIGSGLQVLACALLKSSARRTHSSVLPLGESAESKMRSGTCCTRMSSQSPGAPEVSHHCSEVPPNLSTEPLQLAVNSDRPSGAKAAETRKPDCSPSRANISPLSTSHTAAPLLSRFCRPPRKYLPSGESVEIAAAFASLSVWRAAHLPASASEASQSCITGVPPPPLSQCIPGSASVRPSRLHCIRWPSISGNRTRSSLPARTSQSRVSPPM